MTVGITSGGDFVGGDMLGTRYTIISRENGSRRHTMGLFHDTQGDRDVQRWLIGIVRGAAWEPLADHGRCAGASACCPLPPTSGVGVAVLACVNCGGGGGSSARRVALNSVL